MVNQHIDPEVLTQWEAMFGSDYLAFLSRMIRQFVGEAGSCIEDILAAIEHQDMAQFAEVAHRLKGTCNTMGLPAIGLTVF